MTSSLAGPDRAIAKPSGTGSRAAISAASPVALPPTTRRRRSRCASGHDPLGVAATAGRGTSCWACSGAPGGACGVRGGAGVSSSSTTWASSRASDAPRQKWMPWPKARWARAFSRCRSIVSGSANTCGSRFADPSSRSRFASAGRSVSATRVGFLVSRFQANTGVTSRSSSSTAVGISSGSARSASSRCGCSSSSASPAPSSDDVVSWPANSCVCTRPAISSRVSERSPSR